VKNKRFLNLLCSLCSCNEEAITSNQDDICDLLLDEPDFQNILMRIQTKHSIGTRKIHEVIITEKELEVNGKQLTVSIENFYQYFEEKKDLTLYFYFESMCKLVSLMCLQRNYKGI